MISISPLSGTRNITRFVYSTGSYDIDPFINWGDGTVTYGASGEHVYKDADVYPVFGGSCNSVTATNLSVFDGIFFTDKILVTSSELVSQVSTYHSFTINLSSSNPVNTVILYANGSQSAPYQTERNFWSHLTPEWEFTFGDVQVSEITMTGTPVYSGSYVVGYSAASAVKFLDDMPGNPVLYFTVKRTDQDIPVNSRVYSALTRSICAVDPDQLYITADGINPINPIQWSDHSIPYVISAGSSLISATKILHYLSGEITGMRFYSECHGMALTAMQYNLADINLRDVNFFPTGGFTLSSFTLPGSALNSYDITTNEQGCNFDPSRVEYNKIRKTPRNVSLYATGNFTYSGQSFTLNGASDSFDIMSFENRHEFYRRGEDYNVYDILKQALPFELEQYPNLDTYFKAVAGEGDTLGKVYDRIHNFSKDHTDIDLCTVDALISKSHALNAEIEDFGLEIPEELRRVFNFTTIPLQRLIGTRCVCNTNFVDCAGCVQSDICRICKFDKRSNLGEIILPTDYLSAGETVLYKEHAGKYFNFLHVQPQTTSTFQLKTLSAEPIHSKGFDEFCFYRWNSTAQNNPVESVINYHDPRNMLQPSLSSDQDWYGDNGVVEEMFNYILTRNLINK